ncbi:hypothetical protein OJ996_12040 [Luteolibacter sp. GHJ8]|uniref:Uncharacterized protein n=1 Tax=Luteolibacter rhizosphaerae TaxID=2989719 RepID=A0ABT3G475_9BACT|nr:hypothetical protein [Luteolibacter rhizosphaerae]MCW1914311.1 hypothetical protein [Luteolibacter rhizosphaerae]
MRQLRRYQCFFLIFFAAVAGIALAFNSWANPWRIIPSPLSSQKMEPYRAIEQNWNRTCKAGLASSGSWDAGLFGSSRVDIGLNPRHAVFNGMKCGNFGLNAGLLAENEAMCRYFIEHQNPKLVVLAIDATDLTTPVAKKRQADFDISPLAGGPRSLEQELRYRAGISTLSSSLAATGRMLRGQLAEHTPEGFRREPEYPDGQLLYFSTIYRMAKQHISTGQVDAEKIAMIENIVALCRAKGTRLVIFFTPNHGLFQLAFRELGDPDPYFAEDRRALADLAARANAADPSAPPVEVWDFLDAHPLNTPPMPDPAIKKGHPAGWVDLFHVLPETGDHMLERLQGRGDYGELLLPDGVEARVAKVKAQLDEYEARNPEDVAYLRKSLAKFQSISRK